MEKFCGTDKCILKSISPCPQLTTLDTEEEEDNTHYCIMGDLLINGQRILDGGSASQTNDYTAGEGSERISARHHPRPHVVKIVVGKPSFDRRFNVREIVLRPGDEKVINGVTYKHEI